MLLLDMQSLPTLAQQVGQKLKSHQYFLTIAESCTGGQVAETITSIPGSSAWFERGFITYNNEAKIELLNVPKAIIIKHGSVSAETAKAMAEGALRHSRSHVSLAVTGIAGPEGGTTEKPVGTVWIAWSAKHKATEVKLFHFSGDRLAIRLQAVIEALQNLLKYLD